MPHLTASQVGAAASACLGRAVAGALVLGRLTDRLGRKRLFTVTAPGCLAATLACGLAWDVRSFAGFRMPTGAGMGGECGAANATAQELIPARRRGFADLAIDGSFRIGASGAYAVADPALMPAEAGWRRRSSSAACRA